MLGSDGLTRCRRVRLGAASFSFDERGRAGAREGCELLLLDWIQSSCPSHVKTAAKAAPVFPGLDPARRTRAAGGVRVRRGRGRAWAAPRRPCRWDASRRKQTTERRSSSRP
jgi:hypothetical protein